METLLETIEIKPLGEAKASVIWLHGLGADGHDFLPIARELNLPDQAGIRFVFPHAPHIPVTINGGMVMRAWYDVYSVNFGANEDERGIRQSKQQLVALIENELALGVAAESIFLVGFSQGGAIVLHSGLRYPKKLAGIISLSSYLPLASQLAEEAHIANQNTPLLMMHGTQDTVIPIHLAEQSLSILQKLGYQVEWRQYDMPHSVYPQQIRVLRDWMLRILGVKASD